MAKFLVLWHRNVLAPWPVDRIKIAEDLEEIFDAIERYVDSGIITETSFFVQADSGSFIFEGTSEDVLRLASFFSPVIKFDIKEMIPYKTGKDTMLESLRMKELAR